MRKLAVRLSSFPVIRRGVNMLAHRGIPIFMLHRVLPDPAESYDPELAISTATFEHFLRWLSTEYEIVTVSQLLAEPDKRNRCAITFDDGWRDNFLYAYPVLKRLNVVSSIYLAVNFIGSMRMMWQEMLWRMSTHAGFSNATQQVCKRAFSDYRTARSFFLQHSSATAEAWTAAIREHLDARDPGERSFMTWDEVSQMEDLVEFGSHTMNHVLLKNCDAATAESELNESLRVLAGRLKRSPVGVAYPWGGVNSAVCDLVRNAGCRYGLTVQRGLARGGDDRYLLPRVFVSERSLAAGGSGLNADELKLYLAYSALRRGELDTLPSSSPRSTA